MSTTVTTSGLSMYTKYAVPILGIVLAVLLYYQNTANQNLSLSVLIGAFILVVTMVLHDLEGTTTTTTASSVTQKV